MGGRSLRRNTQTSPPATATTSATSQSAGPPPWSSPAASPAGSMRRPVSRAGGDASPAAGDASPAVVPVEGAASPADASPAPSRRRHPRPVASRGAVRSREKAATPRREPRRLTCRSKARRPRRAPSPAPSRRPPATPYCLSFAISALARRGRRSRLVAPAPARARLSLGPRNGRDRQRRALEGHQRLSGDPHRRLRARRRVGHAAVRSLQPAQVSERARQRRAAGARRHQSLDRVARGLRVRAAPLELAEAAVVVLVGAQPGHRPCRRRAARPAHGGERLQRRAGHVAVARPRTARGRSRRRAFCADTSHDTVALPAGDSRRAQS